MLTKDRVKGILERVSNNVRVRLRNRKMSRICILRMQSKGQIIQGRGQTVKVTNFVKLSEGSFAFNVSLLYNF